MSPIEPSVAEVAYGLVSTISSVIIVALVIRFIRRRGARKG